MEKQYLCIDLKSFYASCECIERNLDPLNTNLVVADIEHTEKTIVLAVSPALKSFGVPGRPRLFEVIQKVNGINNQRKWKAPNKTLTEKSYILSDLEKNPSLEVDYIIAPPQMALYEEYSAKIVEIYSRFVSMDDILVYSIDEVFIDITSYLNTYKMTSHALAMKIIKEVIKETGITATAGIGTNMVLAKFAMDIYAKKMPADSDGVRIAELDEMSFREKLWTHEPLTDFWMIGPQITKKLNANGMHTMGDIALYSSTQSGIDRLHKLFGVNAELIIDHAWGYEPITLEEAKAYKPKTTSMSQGQVLTRPYTYEETELIIKEMVELISLDLVRNHMLTDQIVLHIGYDIENLTRPEIRAKYTGEVKLDHYGRPVPKPVRGTENIKIKTSSTMLIKEAVLKAFNRIYNKDLLCRRLSIAMCKLVNEDEYEEPKKYEQLELFTDYEEKQKQDEAERKALEKERKLQLATIEITNRYGKNAILRGMNLQEAGTTIQRNKQIGGHKA